MKRKAVKNFLQKYNMDFESIDMDYNCSLFVEEMEKGLRGDDSSLMMLPTYITVDDEIPLNKPVIVMDAGGTNFRRALVYFDGNKKPIVEDYKTYAMPGAKEEITKEQFFTKIAEYIEPLLGKSNKIGFCFSYPTEILPNRDGRVIQFSKEVRVKDLLGDVVGENLLKTLKKMGYMEDKKIVLLNDTVATLLGGRASYPDRLFDSYIGLILGTGLNTCYIEENAKIEKISSKLLQNGSMIINIESGGYGKAPMGIIDTEFNNRTNDPGKFTFEKMISGRYQGGLLHQILMRACEDGLFSSSFSEVFKDVKDISTLDMSIFLDYPYGNNALARCCAEGEHEDYLSLYYLMNSVIERAAKLVAINLAAIMIKTGKGKNPCKPVCIAAEGSTFYKLKSFRDKLQYYVKEFINDKLGLYCEFVKAENATLVGTAIAGLAD